MRTWKLSKRVVSFVVVLLTVFCLSSMAYSDTSWTSSFGKTFTVTSAGVINGLQINATVTGWYWGDESDSFYTTFSAISPTNGTFSTYNTWTTSNKNSYQINVSGTFVNSSSITGTWSAYEKVYLYGTDGYSLSGSGTWTAWPTGTTPTPSPNPTTYTLTVTKSGTGSGTVTASTGTLSWSGNTGTTLCPSGAGEYLTAAADNSSLFTSWTGCDTTSLNACYVKMSSAKSVTVTFTSSSDYNAASAGITAIYNQYASFFGTKSGSIVMGTSGSATYYAQWFTNGAAIVAFTDGNMYTYYNGTWYALGVNWK
ncbi:MAG: hypothetical protein HQK95_01915 [Nitrospirae bacterium]|nr:hypothetical protein [Nitrospirota bacterium]